MRSQASLPKGWTLDSVREAKLACPNLSNHAREPAGYCTWFDWAASLNYRGYVQSKCPGCGFYVIWTSTFRDAAGTRQDDGPDATTPRASGGAPGRCRGAEPAITDR